MEDTNNRKEGEEFIFGSQELKDSINDMFKCPSEWNIFGSEEERNERLNRINKAFEINIDQEKINKMFEMPCDWNLGFEEDKK